MEEMDAGVRFCCKKWTPASIRNGRRRPIPMPNLDAGVQFYLDAGVHFPKHMDAGVHFLKNLDAGIQFNLDAGVQFQKNLDAGIQF